MIKQTKTLLSAKSGESRLYNFPTSNIGITCSLTGHSDVDIIPFIKSFKRLYKLDMYSQVRDNTMANLIVLHYVMYIIHSSNFVDYLFNRSRRVEIPQFIIPILSDICTATRSKNKVTGRIEGRLVRPKLVKPSFMDYDAEKVSKILVKAGFTAYSDLRYCESVLKQLKVINNIKDYSNDGEVFEFVIDFLTDLKFITKDSYLPVFNYSPIDCISLNFGIYRFRNNLSSGMYNVNQASIHGLREPLLNLFACFLGIYSPNFLDDNSLPVSHELVVGDTTFDVSDLNSEDFWSFYLSGAVAKTKPKSKATRSKSNSFNKLPSNTLNSDTVTDRTNRANSDVESTSTDNSSRLMSTYLGYYKADSLSSCLELTHTTSRSLDLREGYVFTFRQHGQPLYKYVDQLVLLDG